MLKENDYVRTDLGEIAKVTSVAKKTLQDIVGNVEGINESIGFCNTEPYVRGNIVKHSKDITDLIEVGDVIEVHFPVRNTIRKIYVDEYFEDSMILNGIISGNVILKTILTKEQYMQNCYKCQDIENGTI